MKVYSVADYILSSLGFGTDVNFRQLKNNVIGINKTKDPNVSKHPFYASLISESQILPNFNEQEIRSHTLLELQFILAIKEVLKSSNLTDYSKLLLLISTTKGNINLLDNVDLNLPKERVFLPVMALAINTYFKFTNEPVVVSNACISGVSGLLTGKRLIKGGLYDHVLIVGGDLFSHFVYSGFQSFMALSNSICAPYDKKRDGINLGEAIAGLLLSKDKQICEDKSALSEIVGGGQSNDANHISGPSRDGIGLCLSIEKAFNESGILPSDIDYINAHGTATVFNDEMESIAFSKSGLGKVPLNSLKGYYGHTLGTAGVLESVLTIRQLNQGILLKSMGYLDNGISKQLKILTANYHKDNMKYALKTASGFGGGNAAVIFKKL